MLSPEARLVFRTAAADVKADEWRQLVEGVRDWERVFRLADRQVAAMALWRVLKEIPGVTTAVPQDFAEALRCVALVEDLRMQQLARRAQLTVEALNAAKVPVMLLKGAAIGALSDPSFRSRPMTDVDVLVTADNVEQAASAITSAGWSLTENPVLLELLKDAHHLPHFVDPSQPGVRLELHVSL
ncbi:MAG: nucleotidyltransferase family protein, partial [Pseudomonadales bacterium]